MRIQIPRGWALNLLSTLYILVSRIEEKKEEIKTHRAGNLKPYDEWIPGTNSNYFFLLEIPFFFSSYFFVVDISFWVWCWMRLLSELMRFWCLEGDEDVRWGIDEDWWVLRLKIDDWEWKSETVILGEAICNDWRSIV